MTLANCDWLVVISVRNLALDIVDLANLLANLAAIHGS